MNEFNNRINNKIIELKNRLESIKNSKIPEKSKILFNIKLEEGIDSINEIIDDFEINSLNEFRIDKEIQVRIDENKKTKDIINKFAPLILLYQLNSN